MKKKIKGIIKYTMDKYHPDYWYTLPVSDRNKIQEYSNTYVFDVNNPRSTQYGASMEQMKAYIKHDLLTIAGGGYSAAHIHNIQIEYEVLS